MISKEEYMENFNRIPHYEANSEGTDYIVGDLHGMYDELMDELKKVSFDKEKDRLFCVGDLIDRGPKNLECLRLLDEEWFISVKGNHEEMAYDKVHFWEPNGGKWYYQLDEIEQDEANAYFEDAIRLPMRITVEDTDGNLIGISHAQPCGPAFLKQDIWPREANELIWGRTVLATRKAIPMTDVDYTVHGHTPVDKPIAIGQHIFIDTGCCFGYDLALLKIDDIKKVPQYEKKERIVIL